MPTRTSAPPTQAETEEDRKALKRAIHTSNLVDASVMTGAVTGAIAGLVGGAPGVIAGGVIGAAAGGIAGKVLDEQIHRRDAHDAKLDDEIGVTTGEIGLGDPRLSEPPPSEAELHVAALEAELGEDETTRNGRT